MNQDPLPKVGASFLRRAALAGVTIALMTAAAVSAAVFLEVNSLQDELPPGRTFDPGVSQELSRAEAGKARTFMVLGTDERLGVDEGIEPRSDTIVLIRLDPDKQAIAVMSIPRDLLVDIPGYSERDKINAAFTLGGTKLAVKTVRELLERSGKPFPIHHVVSVNFTGFRRAIDYIGCVYADIDRRYFNDNSGGTNYATIDIQPGYQKVCGSDALDYVRYRHTDNDLIRAARQQDFIRQVKSQDAVRNLLDFSKRRKIVQLFGRYFKSDRELRSTKTLFSVLKLLIFTGQKEIQEVGFKIDVDRTDPAYLYTNDRLIEETVDEFLGVKGSPVPRARAKETEEDREFKRNSRKESNRSSAIPGLEQARTEGENMAVLAQQKKLGNLPFYFPTLRSSGSRYAQTEPRVYRLKDGRGKVHNAYRLSIFNGRIGEYYGVQGLTWKAPPILDSPSETREVDGREFRIYRTGRKVRIVAWETSRGVYWVSNTLNQALNSEQMLGIARSLRRLGQK